MIPKTASPPARRPMPSGNRNVGRNLIRSRQAGISAVSTSAATPTVVPTDSISSASSGSPDSAFTCAAPSGTKAR